VPFIIYGPGHSSIPVKCEDVVVEPQMILSMDSMSISAAAVVALATSTSNSSSNIGESSKRYDIPQQLREDTDELQQSDIPSVQGEPIQDELHVAESTDGEKPLWHIVNKTMRK
jgi:hypothetical protein